MNHHDTPPVVVAVGDAPMDAALTYAVDEAAREGCGVHLVHVVRRREETDSGNLKLDAARDRARGGLPDELPVTSEVLAGGLVVPGLVAAATNARMIVLQRRPPRPGPGAVSRSISVGVAAHALVPVVSVPARWSSPQPSHGVTTVTVGVDVTEHSEEVLRQAMAAARVRGARLRILHTWSCPREYEPVLVLGAQQDAWVVRATGEIRHVLTRLSVEAAGLQIEVDVRRAVASDALSRAAGTSDLLVIGRHDPIVPSGSHIGPVARGVLEKAPCPVLLVDPGGQARESAPERRSPTAGVTS